MKNRVRCLISDWHERNRLSSHFDRTYIFGSLINNSGQQFWPSGAKNSDIDLLIRFNPVNVFDAVTRTKSIFKVHSHMQELETELSDILERKKSDGAIEPIASILPVTWYEIYHCVHKGFDPKIFTLNIFHDVLHNEDRKEGLSDFVDKSFHFDNTETFAVMRLCQKFRNDFLKVNQTSEYGLLPFDSFGSVPKELMRAAALLSFAKIKQDTGEEDPEARTDLSRGEIFLADCLHERKDEDPLIDAVEKKVRDRMSSVVFDKPALNPKDLILLCEILFDKARYLALPSVRETIDRSRRLKQNKPVYV